jgi:hypothetical protein
MLSGNGGKQKLVDEFVPGRTESKLTADTVDRRWEFRSWASTAGLVLTRTRRLRTKVDTVSKPAPAY